MLKEWPQTSLHKRFNQKLFLTFLTPNFCKDFSDMGLGVRRTRWPIRGSAQNEKRSTEANYVVIRTLRKLKSARTRRVGLHQKGKIGAQVIFLDSFPIL